jgi:aminoglycoside/choline kinase family phosphotransferase
MTPIEWFNARHALRTAFLLRAGWGDASIHPVGEDSAFRRYVRLQKPDGETRVLMEAMPDGHPMATPGHSIHDFLRISAYLRSIGLCAPTVYDTDAAEGYVLIEDFGDVSFKRAMETSAATREDLYALATDALIALRQRAKAGDVTLPDYYASHVHTGRRRLVDWYMPAALGQKNIDGIVDDYLAAWDKIEKSLPPVPRGFLHIDYHFENLMWLPGASDLNRCGILDFQGAMTGPVPYDLANLLEDARVDVPVDLRNAMLDRYCADMADDERDAFRAWYRVLATQFHCRVLGQFIRLAVRDGKDRYLAHLPRVAGYIRDGLNDPILAPLADWAKGAGLDFTVIPAISKDTAKLIRPDAF